MNQKLMGKNTSNLTLGTTDYSLRSTPINVKSLSFKIGPVLKECFANFMEKDLQKSRA